MDGSTYKSIELVGSSSESFEDAVDRAVGRASETMRKLKWFEVLEMRGLVEGDEPSRYQARVEVWFELE